jgi:predicted AAA+ superfamily ATPase
MKQQLKTIIAESQSKDWKHIKPRAIKIPSNTGLIISLIGARRSGKTSILFSLIQQLRKQGVPNKNILYINFEDERLNLQTEQLDLILQSYYELHPDIDVENTYFMFDEIQNIAGWEKFVRRIYDHTSKHIFITGSNAKLLSTEIATSLRGRTISYTIYPLSLSEYFNFKQIKPNFNLTQKKAEALNYVRSFLMNGGFPETINLPDDVRIKLLQSYFNTMIYRDIVERYRISDVQILKFYLKKVFSGITKPVSINKIYNDIRSLGYKISNNYLYNFMEYSQTIFLSIPAPKFYFSEIQQEKSDKKIYAIDTGLLNAIEFKFSENIGKLLENMVALEFFKQEKEVFYYKNKYECDFIVKEQHTYKAIQVAYEISDNETEERENRGLAEACSALQLTEGTIITFDQKKECNFNGIKINQVPIYEYFLNKN